MDVNNDQWYRAQERHESICLPDVGDYKPGIECLYSLSSYFPLLELCVIVAFLDWRCLAKVGSSERHVGNSAPRVYLVHLVET